MAKMAVAATTNSSGYVYNGAATVFVSAAGPTFATKRTLTVPKDSTSVINGLNTKLNDRYDDPQYYG